MKEFNACQIVLLSKFSQSKFIKISFRTRNCNRKSHKTAYQISNAGARSTFWNWHYVQDGFTKGRYRRPNTWMLHKQLRVRQFTPHKDQLVCIGGANLKNRKLRHGVSWLWFECIQKSTQGSHTHTLFDMHDTEWAKMTYAMVLCASTTSNTGPQTATVLKPSTEGVTRATNRHKRITCSKRLHWVTTSAVSLKMRQDNTLLLE